MNRASEKSIRLEQIRQLLWAHPEGLTRAEIARRLNIHRSNLTKYLNKDHLPVGIYEDELDGNKLKIDPNADLSRTSFSVHEIMALHLATRLLATRTDKQNPHAASALRKLGQALQRLDHNISQHLLASADVMDEDAAYRDEVYLKVLQRLTEAWTTGRKVKLSHQMSDGKVIVYIFSPYFIEPYAVGQTAHVIGLREPPNQIRTFKIERLRDVEILHEEYTIPESFNPTELLRNAWGIWYTEAEPVEVVLRFHPTVVHRVKETRWHRQQQDEMQPDGFLIWRATIAEPQEMLPWVRGWGASVEVLAPTWLRDEIMQEVQRLSEVYQLTTAKPTFVAHIREKDKKVQSLDAHLAGVAELAGKFAHKIGLRETGELLGQLHDLGKASEKFQRYILSGEGLIDPDAEEYVDPIANKGKIDHTTAGAQVIYQKLWEQGAKQKVAAQILALCIASHHSGLIDCLTPDGTNNFKRRMEKSDENTRRTEAVGNLPEIEEHLDTAKLGIVVDQIFAKVMGMKRGDSPEEIEVFAFQSGLFIRYLLSCLLDGDRLDTADFEKPRDAQLRNYGQYIPWEMLIERLDKKIESFEQRPARNDVDLLRSQISQACLDFAVKPREIYQLTVPTGGGKTLASLRFALHHAKKHEMERVFYVIPYTSIIDQNAEEIRKILEGEVGKGKDAGRIVLEHHSNLTPDEETKRQSLLSQNWDAPVVFTTQVQFLEALFGSGTQSPRRMHALANSVIILDEVQTLPIKTLHMVNVALRFLVEQCGATVILCTATQPPLDKLETKHRALTIQPDNRIIQNERELFERLKRVEVFDACKKVGGWNEAEVAELALQQLQEKGSALIIVNTKKSARLLYKAIAAQGIPDSQLYHLSTNMCATHRLQILSEIREKLDGKEPVLCVSTQLIEAGVDIDFGAVIRYLAGLDSIAQAAGRCNRHGVREGLGNVWIVNPVDENLDNLPDILIGAKITQRILDDFRDDPARFGNDLIGVEAMAAYYRFYYGQRENEMKYNVKAESGVGRDDNLFNLLARNANSVNGYMRISNAAPELVYPQSFQSAAKEFRVIDTMAQGVLVQYGDEGKEIVTALCGDLDPIQQYRLLRRAQRYAVNLFSHEFRKLAESGAIQETQKGSGIYYLDEQYYSEDFGWSEDSIHAMRLLMTETGV